LKRLLFLLLLSSSLALYGCAGSLTSDNAAPAVVQISAKSLLQINEILKAVPATADSMYSAGKIDKAGYNNITELYNRAIAAYKLAVDAEVSALKVGLSPNSSTAYQQAMASLEPLVTQLQALLTGGT
jgi:hypothetical protein